MVGQHSGFQLTPPQNNPVPAWPRDAAQGDLFVWQDGQLKRTTLNEQFTNAFGSGSSGQVLMWSGSGPAWTTLTADMLPDHASRHEDGGADEMAVNAAAGTGSLRSLAGTGSALTAARSDHTHAP